VSRVQLCIFKVVSLLFQTNRMLKL